MFLIFFSSILFSDCGEFKKREGNHTDGTFLNSDGNRCTSVFISDRFVLTAGHCINTL